MKSSSFSTLFARLPRAFSFKSHTEKEEDGKKVDGVSNTMKKGGSGLMVSKLGDLVIGDKNGSKSSLKGSKNGSKSFGVGGTSKIAIKAWARVDSREGGFKQGQGDKKVGSPLFSAPYHDSEISTTDINKVPPMFTPIAIQPEDKVTYDSQSNSGENLNLRSGTRSLFFINMVFGTSESGGVSTAASSTDDLHHETFFQHEGEVPPLPFQSQHTQKQGPSNKKTPARKRAVSTSSITCSKLSTGHRYFSPDGIKSSLKHAVRNKTNVSDRRGMFFTSSEVSVPEKTLTSTSTSSDKKRAYQLRSTSLTEQAMLSTSSDSRSTSTMNVKRKKSAHSVKETSIVSQNAATELAHKVKEKLNLQSIEGTINQYVILRDIGEGSFSKVLLVYNTDDERYYACKTISKKRLRKKNLWHNGPQRKPKRHAETCVEKSVAGSGYNTEDERKEERKEGGNVRVDYMDLVRQEIAIMKRLSKHPHISMLVEVLEDSKSDLLYMVFELCEFGSIMKLKLGETIPSFSDDLARRYFRGIVLGLEYLHYLGVVHRDLKPENILLNATNQAVIENKQQYSVGGNGMLTPMFTPPEIIKNEPSANQSSDIWSLGVTLYCFVHGRVPFEEQSIEALYYRILNEKIEPNRDLPPALRDLLDKMFVKDPTKRITVKEIKKHPWLTKNGKLPMPSTQDNCVGLLESGITQDELDNAVKPAVALFDRLKSIRKKKELND